MALMRSYKNLLIGLTLLCLILLVASAYLFIHDAAALRRAGFLSGREGWHQMRGNQAPAAAGIRTWMTFDFVNDIFNLPPDYLSTTLSIRSSAYPKLTIAQAARAQGTSADAFLQKVQNAVASYSPIQP